VVELAGKDPGRLKDALGVFENFPPSARTKLLEQMRGIDLSILKMDDRMGLAEAIRAKVNRHRRFAGVGRGLKEPVLEELDRVRMRLEPDDVVARNAWLFGDYWKLRWQVERHDGGEEDADKAIERLRATALDEVRADRKWDGVLALAQAAASPDDVGWAAAVSVQDGDDSRALPALLTESRRALVEFAKGYARVRQLRQGWKWVKKLALDEWSDDQVVEFALSLPSERETWDIVANRGPKVEGQYWRQVPQYCFSKIADDVVLASKMLTGSGRPSDAVRQLGLARHRDVKIDPAVIIDVLERCRDALPESERRARLEHVQYDVKLLIQELQQLMEAGDARVEVNKLASLEFVYFEFLDGHLGAPKTLYYWLETQPQFFVELLAKLFPRSDGPKRARPELSESERAWALQVYRLLNSWQRVPGTRPDGSVDEDALRRWVAEVQKLAENKALREEADRRIGNVFAHAPQEPDGSWPCVPVRDTIEEFGTEALADGFEVGIMNKRGAYSKAPDEGGDQERTIAKQYFDWADASKIEWPKTAASLRRVGEQYEAYGRREDAEAESR
jgi:hypothetical protein